MEWKPGQFEELLGALQNAFDPQTFDQMLLIRLRRPRYNIIENNPFPITVAAVLARAAQENWVVELVRAAVVDNPGNPMLQDFVQRFPEFDPNKPLPAIVDHYQSLFVVGNRAFLGRPMLRCYVKMLGQDNNSNVLVIVGSRKSGKTYSRDFISYIIRNDPQQRALKPDIRYVDLDTDAFTPIQLAEKIGRQLNLDIASMPQPKGEQDARMIADLADWISLGVSRANDQHWWLILDGFRLQVLPQATHDLIAALAKMVDFNTPRLRLVLLNYDKLPPDIDVSALKEEIEAIDRTAIETFFDHIYQKHELSYTPDSVRTSVDEIWAQVEAEVVKQSLGREEFLPLLNIAIARASQKISRKEVLV